MVTPIDTPNIRRIYSRPWRDGGLANAGKVPTCIQVAVRPQTTVRALETVFRALPQSSTTRAGLAGVGRVDVFDRDACCLGLVFDEGLQLPPRPAVQAATHAFARLDARANVRQVFHRNLGDTGLDRRLNNGLARLVVDVLHTPRLLAGDLPELLSRALAAVGLKTTAQGKVTVALVAQMLAAEDLAQAMGSEVVFSDIHAQHRAGCHGFNVALLDDEVEKPLPVAQDQLRFLRLAGFEDVALVFAETQRHGDTPIEGIERDGLAFEGVGAFVEVDTGAVEADVGDGGILPDAPEFFLCLIRLADREDGVAAHLAAQRRRFAQHRIGALVQTDAVVETVLAHDGNKTVAGVRIGRSQRGKRSSLRRAQCQPNRRRAHHRSSPLGDILGMPFDRHNYVS